MGRFVHLHLHSQYSLLDGAVPLNALFASIKEKGMDSVAITDHGIMYGVIPFYQKAKKAGVHPILGCEMYITGGSHLEKKGKKEDSLYHLVLLAEDMEGYRNLMELVSVANTNGFYYKPRIDKELLYRYRKGLIALTACLQGEIPMLVQQGQDREAVKALREYRDIMGSENLFVEIQNHDLPEEETVNPVLIDLARQEGLGLVATNDVHYLDKKDVEAHDVLLCIQTGKVLADEERMRFPNATFYLRSPAEMAILFSDHEEALANTLSIASRCKVELSFNKFFLPDYPLSEGYDASGVLKDLCEKGLKSIPCVSPEVEARLSYELQVIEEMGFSSYFLIVRDFIEYARREGIAVGPGRGSVAGSLVAYLVGITGINPLEYGLIFERFLNPERVSLPDIDIDFCYERRDEVIAYVKEKYGQDRVAQIITFGTMAARAAIRDVGRVLGIPYGEVDVIAKEVPAAPGISIEDALTASPALMERYNQDPQARRLLDLARQVEGAPRHASTHAAGVVITPERLTRFTPLQRTKEGITTQYDMGVLEDTGLLKFDFLALRTLTVIHHTLRLIKVRTGRNLDLSRLALDDEKTYNLLQSGHTLGIFQMESALFRRLNREYKPENFEDIIAIIALGRPGPMGSDRLGDFIQCRHGKKNVDYPHPALADILKETYGIILYQEQVMEIAGRLGGFSMGEADILRRAMGKKKGEIFIELREKFIQAAVTRDVEAHQAEKIFNLMEFFGGYGFNKSHSAAYALIAYQTAYLKAHFPLEFMAALLNSVMTSTEKVALYIDECREMGIKVLPPDVNESGLDFTVKEGSIRFGLAAIKNVGKGAIESILKARTEKRFISFSDFCQRVDLGKVNIRVVESLIKSGALDSLGLKRSQLMSMLELTYHQAHNRQKARAQGQLSLLDIMQDGEDYRRDVKVSDIEEYAQKKLLQMEREMLGFYISGHPLDPYRETLARNASVDLSHLNDYQDQEEIMIGGVVAEIKSHQTRKGQQMAFLTLEDWYDQVEVIVFPDIFTQTRQMLATGKALLLRGRIDKQDEDKCKILALEFTPLEETFIIEVPLANLDEHSLQQLHKVLKRAGGSVPIYLRFMEGQKSVTMALGEEYKGPKAETARGELKAKVKELLEVKS